MKSIYDIETDNDFEKRLLSDVIPPNEIKIGFDDIGALDKVKETLRISNAPFTKTRTIP